MSNPNYSREKHVLPFKADFHFQIYRKVAKIVQPAPIQSSLSCHQCHLPQPRCICQNMLELLMRSDYFSLTFTFPSVPGATQDTVVHLVHAFEKSNTDLILNNFHYSSHFLLASSSFLSLSQGECNKSRPASNAGPAVHFCELRIFQSGQHTASK